MSAIVYGILGSPFILGRIAKAEITVFYQIAIAQMHTTLEIVIGEKDGFIRAAKETLIKAALYWVPIFILISTGQNQNEPEAGEFFF